MRGYDFREGQGEQGLGCWIDSLVGVLILEFDRAPVSERGVEPALVVDLVDEAWKCMDDVGECLVAAEIRREFRPPVGWPVADSI
jgi:hypothetical protein